ncbi:MAG: hypothetical protein J7J91_11885 [Deltaproteobacteria bacterium]|nr:hypothetical protein [Deltaproteobacteria bacterium]
MEKRENEKLEELMELLAKEQTLTGQYYGHCGQRNVAEREYLYCEEMLVRKGEKMSETEKKTFMRWRDKAKARMDYHAKMAEEAKKELEEVRRRIKEILGGERE